MFGIAAIIKTYLEDNGLSYAIPTGIDVAISEALQAKITWVDSISVGVTHTVIYRDDVELGRVAIGVEEFIDLTCVQGQTYKYEVQAFGPEGETTSEIEGTNVQNKTIELSVTAPTIIPTNLAYTLSESAAETENRFVMNNFRVLQSDTDKVYFDSTGVLTATDETGFVIWEDVDITGISINAGSTTGHYLTLSGDLDIFSNPLIEYDNGNVKGDGLPLNKMRLQRVTNDIDEPTPLTEYYIDGSVGSSGNGLSEGAAFKTLAEGFAVLAAGVKLWVKQGVYSEGGLSSNLDGTSANPWQIEGYKNSPGDGAELTRSVGMSFDSSELPWLKTTSANGFSMDYAAYFVIKNFQFSGADDENIAMTHAHHGLIKNVYGEGDANANAAIGWMNDDTGNTAHGHVRLERCYGANGTGRVMRFQGRNNRAIDTWAVTSQISNQDYYFSFYGTRSVANGGSGESTGCSALDCYIHRLPTDTHRGHGVSMKAGGTPLTDIQVVSHGLIENIDIINVGQAIELRHPESYEHVVRDVRGSGDVAEANTITFRDGTHHNWVEDCRQDGGWQSIRFTENEGEHGTQAGGYDNTVVNFISNGPESHIAVHQGWDSGTAEPPLRNKFINCTFYGGDDLAVINQNFLSTNEITNCIIDGVTNLNSGSKTFNPVFTNCNFNGNGFANPSGTNITSLDPGFVDTTGFEPTNANLISGIAINDLDTDFNYNDRSNPTTLGAVLHADEVSGGVEPTISSYVFDGTSNSWFEIDQNDILNGIVSQSWVIKGKITASGVNASFIGQKDSGVNLRFGVTSSNTIRWRLSNSSITGGSFDNNEHIYIATYDGTFMKVYQDGVQILSSNDPDWTGGNNGRTAAIGRSSSSMVFVGEQEEVQFYNKALSQSEIDDLQIDLSDTATGLVAHFAGQKTSTTWTSEVNGYTATNQGGVTLV